MTCKSCQRGGWFDYSCQACCVRLLLNIPFVETRRALMDSIWKFHHSHNRNADAFLSAVKTRFIFEWEQRKALVQGETNAKQSAAPQQQDAVKGPTVQARKAA